MGASDFNTGALVKGTAEEIVAAAKIFLKYATQMREQYAKEKNCPYLQTCYIAYDGEHGLGTRVSDMTDEDIAAFAAAHDNKVILSAGGPYGVFWSLKDVALFREIAEAIPNATVSGGMSGFGPGGQQIVSYELEDGLMTCKYHEGDDGEWDEDEEDEDWEDDWDDEEDFGEPDWDYEEVYDPIAKKFLKK